MIAYINVQSLQNKIREKTFDLTQLMSEMRFDHIGLDETSRDCTTLSYQDRNPQRFCRHEIIQQMEKIINCNEHKPFLGSLQYIGTAYISTGNITGKNTGSGRDPYGTGIWDCQRFMGQVNASL